jgi:hypothetical protein
MADNSTLPATGNVIRDKDRAGVLTQIVGLDINIGGSETLMVAGQQLAASCIPVVLPVTQDGTKAEDAASADGDRGVAVLAVRKASPANTSGTDGDYEFLQISGGRLWASATIDAALPAGTNLIGTIALQPTTSGGCSVYRNLDLGTTGQVAKASAGQVYGWVLKNRAAAERFVKIYDKASAPSGADTPVYTIPLDPGQVSVVAFPNGDAFAAGVSVRATTGIADADTGAPTTNDVVVAIRYK